MTRRFLPSEKSMSITRKLSGRSLFDAAGVRCDFATSSASLSLTCWMWHGIQAEYAPHLAHRLHLKLICGQQSESGAALPSRPVAPFWLIRIAYSHLHCCPRKDIFMQHYSGKTKAFNMNHFSTVVPRLPMNFQNTHLSRSTADCVYHIQIYVKSHPIKSSPGRWTDVEVSSELCVSRAMTSPRKTHAPSPPERLRPRIVGNYPRESVLAPNHTALLWEDSEDAACVFGWKWRFCLMSLLPLHPGP